MAAGQHWKRPWEDDDSGFRGHSQRILQDARRTSESHSGFESAKGHDKEHLTREDIPRSSLGMEKPASVSSDPVLPNTHAYVRLNTNSKNDPVDHYARSTPSSNCPKRRRLLQDEQLGDVIKVPLYANGQQNSSLRLEGVAGNSIATQISDDSTALSSPRFIPLSELEQSQNLSEREIPVEMNHSNCPSLESLQAQKQCPLCSKLQCIVGHIIKGLCGLQSELSIKLASENLDRARMYEDYQREAPEVTKYGLMQSLDWVLVKVNDSIRVVKDLMALETSKMKHPKETFYNNMHFERLGNAEDDTARQSRTILDVGRERVSPPQSDDGSRPLDMSRIHSTLLERRKSGREFFPPNTLPSPHPNTSLSNNIFTRPQSPMQAPSRLLPSPSSMSFSGSSILPPMSPSIYQSKSPHTAHLQELQHQLSTKSLAHQILQGEHDKLLAAFSRSQTRCATLDRKSQASETEINNLSEDQVRMQAQIEAYETQIEDLQESRDEAWKQSSATGAQYMHIINISSKLQAKGVIDSKRWKEEKEGMEKEKVELMAKIKTIEVQSGQSNFDPGINSSQDGLAAAQPSSLLSINTELEIPLDEDVVSSTSVDVLRREIIRLRMMNHDTQKDLEGVRGENVHIKEIISILDGVSRRMATKEPLT